MIKKDLYNGYQFNNKGFGLEIELTTPFLKNPNITRSERREAKEAALKKACDIAQSNQAICNGIRIMYDGSATVAIEIVFPILFDHSRAWNYIDNVLKLFKENDFIVASDNGMHMHISTYKALEIDKSELIDKSISHQASKISRHICRFGYNTIDFSPSINERDYFLKEELFQYNTEMEFELIKDVMLRYSKGLKHIEKFLPLSRSNNDFCSTSYMTENYINNSTTLSDFSRHGKFVAINTAPFKKGTIEFRQALTTLNVDKVIVWFRFLDNLIRYSDTKRLTRIAESIYNVPNSLRPYLTRSNTRQELLYTELYNSNNEIGIQTSELMDNFGLTSQSIRRLISDIHSTFNRNQINSNDFLITHTFRENGSNYGDGITNTSYQIVKQVNRNASIQLLPDNRIGMENIFSDLDDDTFSYLHQAKTNRLMRI